VLEEDGIRTGGSFSCGSKCTSAVRTVEQQKGPAMLTERKCMGDVTNHGDTDSRSCNRSETLEISSTKGGVGVIARGLGLRPTPWDSRCSVVDKRLLVR